jgi:hypothetical protein
MHYSLVEVVYNAEFLELGRVLNHVLLDLLHFVIFIIENAKRILICIVVQVDKTVVKEESAVALLTIAIVDLVSPLDIVKSINHEPASIVCVIPGCLSGTLVIQHVGVGNETISLYSFDLDAEDTTGDHHADLRVFTDGELSEFGDFLAN